MNKKRRINNKTPNIISGGKAISIGDDKYLMKGKKHSQGGIDIGKNPKTGLEVEDGEIVEVKQNKIKVYSAVPFLNGESPASKVLDGEDPNTVFNAQENYKDTNGLNDDGSMRKKKINGGSLPTGDLLKINSRRVKRNGGIEKLVPNGVTSVKDSYNLNNAIPQQGVGVQYSGIDNGLNIGSLIENIDYGAVSNLVGSVSSLINNKRALNKMQNPYVAPEQPISKRSTKLKTNININPQLDKMRENTNKYIDFVNNNTSSSRVGLARTNNALLDNIIRNNEIYSNKENMETQLINQDKLNQQNIDNANVDTINAYNQNLANIRSQNLAFENKLLEMDASITQDTISGINSTIQDMISRKDKNNRYSIDKKMIQARYPNVSSKVIDSIIANITKNE